MIVELISLLAKYGQSTVERIKQNIVSTGTNATGKTAKSLRYEISVVGTKTILMVIGARPYFATIETGRKATPNFTKPSVAFVASIKEWVKAKGLPEGSAYAIAKSIHKHGTKLHQAGGRQDIISNVANQGLIQSITKHSLTKFADLLLTNVREVYGSRSN